jgi:hypothetical protein
MSNPLEGLHESIRILGSTRIRELTPRPDWGGVSKGGTSTGLMKKTLYLGFSED